MDVAIIETLNGGDAQLNGNDFALVDGFENTIYLAMFGGNPGFSTPTTRKEGEQLFDWFGNRLFMLNTPTQQFNSLTEHTLNTVALNSQGRILIENAIKQDLQFLQEFGKVEIEVSIISDDKLKILIRIIIPNGQTKITIVNFEKTLNGDWYFADFDKTDFFI